MTIRDNPPRFEMDGYSHRGGAMFFTEIVAPGSANG
jgi:hypothetical protein